MRIASAVDRDLVEGSDFNVSWVRLDYLPGKALVEIVPSGHTNNVANA